jgi:hypothetical protein
MLLTIMLIVVAMAMLAAFETWLFWWLSDRDDRRHAAQCATDQFSRDEAVAARAGRSR